jgi:hypothetical protein
MATMPHILEFSFGSAIHEPTILDCVAKASAVSGIIPSEGGSVQHRGSKLAPEAVCPALPIAGAGLKH